MQIKYLGRQWCKSNKKTISTYIKKFANALATTGLTATVCIFTFRGCYVNNTFMQDHGISKLKSALSKLQ